MTRKNVLVLVLDGMRADRLGCYGHSRNTSPAIDRFAKRSMLCINNYTVGKASTQSHVSLFTGVHPQFHGAADNCSYYDGRFPTLPELLGKSGYYTYGISSFNPFLSIESGILRGYERYVRITKSKAKTAHSTLMGKITKGIFGRAVGLDEAYRALLLRVGYKLNRYWENFYLCNDSTGQLLVDTFTRELKAFPKDRPFFAFANIVETHAPYLAPKAFREFWGKVEISDSLSNALFSYADQFEVAGHPLSKEEREVAEILYDSKVRYTDFLVGQLIEGLEREGRLEDTVVIITSDHGGMLGEHESMIGPIRNTYQGIMKTPLIVHCPGMTNKEETRLTSIVDVFATILAIAGAKSECGFNYQCQNILSDKWGRDFVICEIPPLPYPELFIRRTQQIATVLKDWHVNRTIITRDYKLIWRSNGRHHVYDLRKDPGEANNLFPVDGAGVFKDLLQKMIRWYEDQWQSDKPFCLETFEYNQWNTRKGAGPTGINHAQDPSAISVIADSLNRIVSRPEP